MFLRARQTIARAVHSRTHHRSTLRKSRTTFDCGRVTSSHTPLNHSTLVGAVRLNVKLNSSAHSLLCRTFVTRGTFDKTEQGETVYKVGESSGPVQGVDPDSMSRSSIETEFERYLQPFAELYQESIDAHKEALDVLMVLKTDEYDEEFEPKDAIDLLNRALVALNKSREYYKSLAHLHNTLPSPALLGATILFHLGVAHLADADIEEAESSLKRSLVMREREIERLTENGTFDRAVQEARVLRQLDDEGKLDEYHPPHDDGDEPPEHILDYDEVEFYTDVTQSPFLRRVTLVNLGDLYSQTENAEKAIDHYRQALDGLEEDMKLIAPDEDVFLEITNAGVDLINIMLSIGEREDEFEDEILSLSDMIMSVRTRFLQTAEHEGVVELLSQRAQILDTLDRSGEATAYYREAVDLGKKTFGEPSPEVGQLLHFLARHLASFEEDDQELYEEADGVFNESARMLEETIGPGDEMTTMVLWDFAAYLRRRGLDDRIEDVAQRGFKAFTNNPEFDRLSKEQEILAQQEGVGMGEWMTRMVEGLPGVSTLFQDKSTSAEAKRDFDREMNESHDDSPKADDENEAGEPRDKRRPGE